MNTFVSDVNRSALQQRDDTWTADSVPGIGPSRSFFFLSNEVARGSVDDGFHRTERPLLAKMYMIDGSKYFEYNGFWCANRPIKVIMEIESLWWYVQLNKNLYITVLPSPHRSCTLLGRAWTA